MRNQYCPVMLWKTSELVHLIVQLLYGVLAMTPDIVKRNLLATLKDYVVWGLNAGRLVIQIMHVYQ